MLLHSSCVVFSAQVLNVVRRRRMACLHWLKWNVWAPALMLPWCRSMMTIMWVVSLELLVFFLFFFFLFSGVLVKLVFLMIVSLGVLDGGVGGGGGRSICICRKKRRVWGWWALEPLNSLPHHYVDSSKDGLVWGWLYSDWQIRMWTDWCVVWRVSQPVDMQSNQSQLFLDEAQKHSNSHVKESVFLYVQLPFFF